MLVVVGNKVFDPNKEPVMLVLSDADKKNITNMAPEATKYCCYPDGMPPDEVREFMKRGTLMTEIIERTENVDNDPDRT